MSDTIKQSVVYALEIKTRSGWAEIVRRDTLDEIREIQARRWTTEQTIGEISRIVEETRRVVE